MPRVARRRMIYGKIGFISLCPKGASRLPVIYKEDDPDAFELQLLTKEELTEQGELHCCVYAPELVDSQDEVADRKVIKQIAHDFLRDGGQIDIRHNDKPVPQDQAYVAESFIIQKNDARFAGMRDYDGKIVDVTGGWGAVLKIESEDLRSLYRSGEWGGVSMGGRGKFRDVSIYDPLHKQNNNPNPDTGEFPMDEKQITELVTKAAAAAVAAAFKTRDDADAVKVAKEASDKQAKELEDLKKSQGSQVKFEGDPQNTEDVKKHLLKVAAAKVDWDNPESVQKHLESLKASDDGLTPAERKVKKLQEEIRQLEGGSNQGGGGSANLGGGTDEDEVAKGFRLAHEINVEAGVVKKADDSKAVPQTKGYLIS